MKNSAKLAIAILLLCPLAALAGPASEKDIQKNLGQSTVSANITDICALARITLSSSIVGIKK